MMKSKHTYIMTRNPTKLQHHRMIREPVTYYDKWEKKSSTDPG